MKKLLIVLVALLMISACSSQTTESEEDPTDESEIAACVLGQECETEEDTPNSELMDWPIIAFEDSLDYVEGTAILFYSFDDCPYCKEAIPVLDELVSETDIAIYYVHTERDQREAGNEDYDRVYAYFAEVIENAGYDTLYMPSIFFIKDEEVVAYHVGTVDGHDPSVATMTDEQITELSDLLASYIELLG